MRGAVEEVSFPTGSTGKRKRDQGPTARGKITDAERSAKGETMERSQRETNLLDAYRAWVRDDLGKLRENSDAQVDEHVLGWCAEVEKRADPQHELDPEDPHLEPGTD